MNETTLCFFLAMVVSRYVRGFEFDIVLDRMSFRKYLHSNKRIKELDHFSIETMTQCEDRKKNE